jgi:acetolactate synthase-1/3 small subunit
MLELTGNQSKLEAFLNLLDGYEILELARTGITGLSRGMKDITFIDEDGQKKTWSADDEA